MVLVKTHVYMKLKKSKWYFFKMNSFIITHLNFMCECIRYLSIPPTNLSFTFYLKNKILTKQT